MSTSTTAEAHAIAHEPSGKWLQSRPGECFSIRIPASATNGCYSVTEILSSAGDSTPVHLHEREDEHILVVEGTARSCTGTRRSTPRLEQWLVSLGVSRMPGEIPLMLRFVW
jgi:mannose-6-phosphate isomerase-like protein (cupin superfamily)